MDYATTGEPIGLELTAPSAVDVATVNEVLHEIGMAPVESADLAPLHAA